MDAAATHSNSATAAIPPDWDAVAEEIRCPLCEYNLRGLIEARCPECGFRLAWPELLDPSRLLHPFLFEHNRGVRAFWRTLIAGWRPKRFWSRLHPAQPSRPRRLIRYWLLCALPIALSVLTGFTALVMGVVRSNQAAQAIQLTSLNSPRRAEYARRLVQQYGSLQNYLDTIAPTDPIAVVRSLASNPGFFLAVLVEIGAPLSWTWLTLGSLLLFQFSMQHARIHTVHVLRCVIYASDVFFWTGLGVALFVPAFLALLGLTASTWAGILNGLMVLLVLAPLIASYRLVVAYRRYLKFDRPVGTILASQVIVLLVGLIIFWAPWVWL